MKAPGYRSPNIPRGKIIDYLLCVTHPIGRSKAQFFINCGYPSEDWTVLRDALYRHVAMYDVASAEATEFGIRYVVEGGLVTPKAGMKTIRSVWFVQNGTSDLRLVTAYPTTVRMHLP